MNQPIVTAQLRLNSALRDPSEAEVAAVASLLAHLVEEAKALGAHAAPVHHAMGRIWIERLGDPRSAASCFQAAFALDPKYRPNLEAARRLFAAEGQWEKSLAIHQKEEALLVDPAARAESLRAQARILVRELKRPEQAAARVEKALQLAPEHPALLRFSVEAAERGGDRLGTARLLLRSAGTIKDDVQRGLMLRRAVLLFEELHLQAMSEPAANSGASEQPFHSGAGSVSSSAAELEQLHEEALRRLSGACPGDPIPTLVMAQRARAAGSWDQLLQLAHEEAERSGAASERLLAAQIAAFKQTRAQEALSELRLGLVSASGDSSLRALELELVAKLLPGELPAVLASAIAAASGPSERADLQVLAAIHATGPLEKESLLSEALAENPGDAAAIAFHARLVAERDAHAAAERYVALAEALESHAPAEAADQYAEAGLWLERSGARDTGVSLARRALALQPGHGPSQRILARELPFLGEQGELAALLEELAATAPPWQASEFLARAASLLSDLPALGEAVEQPESETQIAEVSPMQRALDLAQRSAEIAKGLKSPRGSEGWTLMALRAGDGDALGRSLELRADGAEPSEAAELLLEAGELARVQGKDARALSLLQRARKLDANSVAVRRALLHLPDLPLQERVEALAEEAIKAEPARAAALHAERAALLESGARFEDAVQACALALSSGGVDVAVLRRLSRLQLRLGDLPAALAVLEQIAQELPEGAEQAAAYGRAAEVAEWRLGDPSRAGELYARAVASDPSAVFALAGRARLLHWGGYHADAAESYEALARASKSRGQKLQALRIAASLRTFRTREPGRAAELLRQLIIEDPSDLDAMAALLSLGDAGGAPDGRKERAELRAKLASRCQDPRLAALLRADSAEDRFAAGERDQGVAELRRALALNPHDRIALDLVEESLRASQNRQLLIDHLAFRCACEEGSTRAALSMEQAELFIEEGKHDKAATAYRLAIQSDPSSMLAVRGARRLAEQMGDKLETMKLLSKESALCPEPKMASGLLREAARVAEELGEIDEAVEHLTAVLERDPRDSEVAAKLRSIQGEGGAQELASLFERIGGAEKDPAASAFAWAQAGRIQLDELLDAQTAFVFAGRAIARVADLPSLLLRADAGESISRYPEAAEALVRAVALAQADGAAEKTLELELRLGRLYLHALGAAKKALPLLVAHLQDLDVETLLVLAPHAGTLAPAQAIPLYRRLLEIFPAPAESGSPTRSEIAAWLDALAAACVAVGDTGSALETYRRAVQFEPENKVPLEKLAELAAESAPEEAIAAWRRLFEMAPRADALHALVKLFLRKNETDSAFVAASLLVGIGDATAEETGLHDAVAKLPPAGELPSLSETSLRADDDTGPARALLAAAAPELARAFPTQIAGRAERVKGDNPVRRVCAALARSIGLAEPALYLSKSEPSVVLPAAVEPPGLIVGEKAPRTFPPRVQRFLYSRALAHLKNGTHAILELTPRLAALCTELARLCAPPLTDLSKLPPREDSLAAPLAAALDSDARARLTGAAREHLAAAAFDPALLALAIRESAERVAMILCGDPAAALGVVVQECPGGLSRPEVARLARFALSPAYLTMRAR